MGSIFRIGAHQHASSLINIAAQPSTPASTAYLGIVHAPQRKLNSPSSGDVNEHSQSFTVPVLLKVPTTVYYSSIIPLIYSKYKLFLKTTDTILS